MIYREAITGGTSTDSVSLVVRVFSLNDTGAILYYQDVDTISTIVGEAFDLDVGGKVFGDRITVKLKAITDLGDLIIVPDFHLIKRYPVHLEERSRL